ncbi:MAG: hypothetical protein ABIP74_01435 [Candidatus Saccharimonas sp.]
MDDDSRTSQTRKDDTPSVLIHAWKNQALGLSTHEKVYASFDDNLISLMRKVRKDMGLYAHQVKNERGLEELRGAADIIQDGCARLSADFREGMDYEVFCLRVQEEKKIWFEQLYIREDER